MSICRLSTNGHWAVDGTPIYVPDGAHDDNDNIVGSDTGRAESGYMYITWIRPNVRQVKLTYKWLTGAEKDLLHNLMQGREFRFTYFDSGIKTMEAYAGKDSYALVDPSLYASEGGLYKDYSVDVVEK